MPTLASGQMCFVSVSDPEAPGLCLGAPCIEVDRKCKTDYGIILTHIADVKDALIWTVAES